MSSSSSSFLPPPLIGLTGGIASGKSIVSQLLQERKARVIDADHIARTVVLPESKGLSQLVNIWGDQILTSSGDLDRPALGTLIFNDPQARTQLNQILHPLIAQESIFQIDDVDIVCLISYILSCIDRIKMNQNKDNINDYIIMK